MIGSVPQTLTAAVPDIDAVDAWINMPTTIAACLLASALLAVAVIALYRRIPIKV
jgi:hypothetical protein